MKTFHTGSSVLDVFWELFIIFVVIIIIIIIIYLPKV